MNDVQEALRRRLARQAERLVQGRGMQSIVLGTESVDADLLESASARAGVEDSDWRVGSVPGPGAGAGEVLLEARGRGACGFLREIAEAAREELAVPDSLAWHLQEAAMCGLASERAREDLLEGLGEDPGLGIRQARASLAGLASSFVSVACGPLSLDSHPMDIPGNPSRSALLELQDELRRMGPGEENSPLFLAPPGASGRGWTVGGLTEEDEVRVSGLRRALERMGGRPGGFVAEKEPEEPGRALLGRWGMDLLSAAGWPSAGAGATALHLARWCGVDPLAEPRAGAWLAGVAAEAPEEAEDILFATEAALGGEERQALEAWLAA